VAFHRRKNCHLQGSPTAIAAVFPSPWLLRAPPVVLPAWLLSPLLPSPRLASYASLPAS